ncbi:hypothetical protein FCL38_07815 [Pseudoduganella umbonata]|uniref:Secreted protein n=1 Tax=Pseudoduganella umbonata TaxID=864828 RepID=A0ABX5UIZ9_9BURK|nr:hypothetical protein FCL38_07815 [Pseudoduganella umbonata]
MVIGLVMRFPWFWFFGVGHRPYGVGHRFGFGVGHRLPGVGHRPYGVGHRFGFGVGHRLPGVGHRFLVDAAENRCPTPEGVRHQALGRVRN